MKAVCSAFWVMMLCSRSLTASGSHKDSPCCLIPRPGQCKYACENIPASKYVSNLTRKSSVTEDLESVCSHEKRGFWSCINRHLRGNLWIGSACCHRGHGWHCQAACVNATSMTDLQRSCRRSDEVELYNCLEQKLKSDQCCRKAKGNRDCAAACRDAVSAELVGVSEAIVSKLTSSCAKSPEALECVSRQLGLEQGDTQDTASEGRASESAEARLVCCEESSARACQDVCRSVLISGSGEQDIMDELVTACGEPNLTDKLWQCILKSSTNSKPKEDNKRKQQPRSPSGPRKLSGVRSLKDKPVLSDEVDLVESPSPYTKIQVFADYDYFDAYRQHATSSKKKLEDFTRHKKLANDLMKLKCCNKESTDDCQTLCQEVYTDDYSRILDFEKKCLNNPTGSEMQGCLLDVEEPCQPGCDGLNFCSLFNQRSTETFRSCTIASDNAAQIDYASWVSGKSSISFLQHRLSLNVTRCHPEMWQAFSCYHHIKPCGRRRGSHSGTPKICMKDCYNMLNECLPDSDGAEIANYVCSIFASASDSDCISLTEYLNFDQKKMGAQTQITVPCISSNSCSENQVCQPERRQDSTLSQTCRAGCRLGESSTKMVPTGVWVTAPCGAEGCHKICRCDESGAFDKCVKLPSVKSKPCIVGNREIEHGSQFAYDCNVCGCNAGELTCTKRKCHHLSSSSRRTLPCKCPEDYEPVCGRNGKTYPNHCIASRCNLQTAVTAGPCSQPAEESRAHCLSGHIAVARTSVCLAYKKFQESLPCEQFVCVPTKAGNCVHENLGAVCDIYGQTHMTVCDFARAQVPLAHWGFCQRNCSHLQVCGIDGQTYKTECVSKANHVPTDYTGACNSFAASCSAVQCPPTPTGCKIVTPPGACCPKCLSYLQMVLSNKQLYKLVMAAESQNFVSVSYILSILRTFVSVSECKLGGYLHYEGDLIVYTFSEEGAYEVCEVELERIYEAFLRQSAQVQLDPVLSAVVAVDWNTGQGGSLISGAKSVQAVISIFLLQVTMLCYYY